jgi:hypothetical protein
VKIRPWIHPVVVALAIWPFLLAGAPPDGPRSAPGPACRTGAYHGGALLVTDPRLAPGHLFPGQILPIRLSRLTPPPGQDPPPGGAEDPASVRYGQLEFLEVDPGRVTFRAAFRLEDGTLGQPRTFTLGLGDSVDLGGTGLPDLSLRVARRPLAAGAERVAYSLLAFRCDAVRTAMFALAPEAFPGGRYPYGISGATPSGHFIFQSDHLGLAPSGAGTPAQGAALLPAEPGREVETRPGDVLVDLRDGRVGKIEQARRAEQGWDVQFAEARTPYQFQKVFGAAYVHVSGTPAQLAGRYGGRNALPLDPGNDGTAPDLVDLDGTWTLADNAYGRVDLQVKAHLGVAFDLSANLNYHGLSTRIQARVDETVRLAADCRIDQSWNQDLGCITLADPKLVVPVYGIPLSFSLPVTAGMVLESDLHGHALEGLESQGHWAWSEQLDASWGWRGVHVDAQDPVTHSSLQVDALPENSSDLTGKASVRPKVTVAPTFGIAGLLYGASPTTLSAAGALTATGSANPPGLSPELSARWQLDVGLRLDLPVLGKVWDHDWPVYDWTGIVGPRLR